MTIHLGYGLITCQSHPDDPRTTEALVDEAVSLAVEAERIGLDSVWVSEHHHVDDGHLGALLTMLAGLATVTSRIALGTGVVLAPLHEPVRIAEEAALVDLLSHGRLILGLGLGWREEEFAAVGVSQRERGRRLEDTVAVLRHAARGEPTRRRADGQPMARITPARVGGPPLWIGALSEPGIARAGRIADGLLATEVTPAELAAAVEQVRAAAVAAGRDPGDITIALHLPTLVTQEPWAAVRDRLRYPGWKYEDMDGQWASAGPLGRPGPWAAALEEERLRSTSLVGPPRAVADRIREYAAAAGGDLHMVARSYLPGSGAQAQRAALAGLATVRDLLGGA